MLNHYGVMLEPIQIGSMELKNRVCISPMDFKWVYGNVKDSTITQRTVDFYRARAKGGAGLVLTSHVKAEQDLDPFPRSQEFPIIDRDERVKEFAELADAVHAYGAKIAAELSPGSGRMVDILEEGDDPISASEVPSQYDSNIMCRPLTVDEIHYLTEAYGKAAGRLKQAGFDAIMIHASSGYLIGQFLSPAWNHREDEYGGTPEKRMRFVIECIESAKKYVGEKFPILMSFNVDEKFENINMGAQTTGEAVSGDKAFDLPKKGMTVDYAIQVAQKLESMGYVDAYHVKIGNYYNQEHMIPSAYSTNEEYKEDIIAFRAGVTKSVIFDNKLAVPEEMQKMIEDGVTDMVSMGRQWIAEKEWVKKALTDSSEIRPCIRCMMCIDTTWNSKYCKCSVNPEFGREGRPLTPALEKKNVIVVGGGPGGMTAAVTAARRGHNVELIEKKECLGGRLYEAGANAYKIEVLRYCEWLKKQVGKLPIKVTLNTAADAEMILNRGADAVIVASGADTVLPFVPGGEYATLAEEVLVKDKPVGERVYVIGGGLTGCETAYKLWKQGKKVSIVELMPDILLTTSVVYRHAAVKLIRDTDIEILCNSRVGEIKEDGVVIDGELHKCDDVVWAVGLRGNDKLYRELAKEIPEVYVVGDAKRARKVFYATQEAYEIAAEL